MLRRNPAANVRRPRVDHESHTLGLDRNELGALLVQAGLGARRGITRWFALFALSGLRISEALNADVEDLGVDRGQRTLRIVRKAGKRVTIPLAPRTSTALDLYIGERADGPIFVGATGQRLTPPRRRPHSQAARPASRVHEADLAAQPAPLIHHRRSHAGVPLRDVQEAASHADPRTTMRYDRGRQ